LKWEKKWLKKLEKEIPSQAATVVARQVNIQSAGTFRYSYGAVDMRRFPLLRSCKFLVVDGAGGSMVDMGLDDINLAPSSSEIPLASNFGQVLLATLLGIPLRCKLALIKTRPEETTQSPPVELRFFLPNGFTMTKFELIMVSAAAEIADEVYGCSGVAHRMSELAQDVQSNTAAYVTNGRAVLQGMELIKREVKERKTRNSQVSQTIREINRHIGHVQRNLRRAGVDSSNLPPLVSMKHLQDHYRVHRSHQHRVKDKRWNLVG